MIALLILIPLLAGLAAFTIPDDRVRRILLIVTATLHSGLTAWCGIRPPAASLGGWIALDALGLLFLGITSALFLAVSLYAVDSLRHESKGRQTEPDTGSLFINAPEPVYTGCLLLFLSTMTLVTVSQHFGLLWVAVEATTLATAPLIYFHRQARSLEATWKYLLVCSVGIALALLGNFLLAVAAAQPADHHAALLLSTLLDRAAVIRTPWLKVAFVFLLVGYGTKMGLAPLHTWLPDAHSEAPSPISALLSGALLNCAFLGILRAHAVCSACHLGAFSGSLLTALGLLSVFVAAIFVVRQPDYKRLLAYSSVENVGLLAIGVGLGGAAAFGAMLHAVNHSLVKAALFMAAGNILAAYHTKDASRVHGLARTLPVTAAIWIAGLFAISGTPPFGSFVSEFIILKSAFGQGHYVIASATLLALTVVFAGMAAVFLRMFHGPQSTPGDAGAHRETISAVLPALVFLVMALVLGSWIPGPLRVVLQNAAVLAGGSPL